MTEADQLRSIYHYDMQTGHFTWRVAGSGRVVGKRAGSVGSAGYRHMKAFGRQVLAHRLAWLYVTGKWPRDMVDHINGNRDDNRFANLRECDKTQNHGNAVRKPNSLGYQGVARKGRRFVARIHYRGHSRILGNFDSAEDAHEAYVQEHRRLHGEFCVVD